MVRLIIGALTNHPFDNYELCACITCQCLYYSIHYLRNVNEFAIIIV